MPDIQVKPLTPPVVSAPVVNEKAAEVKPPATEYVSGFVAGNLPDYRWCGKCNLCHWECKAGNEAAMLSQLDSHMKHHGVKVL